MKVTDRQQEVLDFIREFIDSHGYSPSTREIQQHFNFSSQNAAMNHVNALVSKGKLSRVTRFSRTIRVIEEAQ